jgi:hypothetical protein
LLFTMGCGLPSCKRDAYGIAKLLQQQRGSVLEYKHSQCILNT